MELIDVLNNKEKALGKKDAVITRTIDFQGMEITFHFKLTNPLVYKLIMESMLDNIDLEKVIGSSEFNKNPQSADAKDFVENELIGSVKFKDWVGIYDELLARCLVTDKQTKEKINIDLLVDEFPPSLRIKMGEIILEESGISGKPDINS